ncbi:ornithine cyclodeaminase family protein [Phenylobacterium sp.]|jgi:ornithine cyclodeaminase/alanine dehydrogenase-like protein (mu-crystallin family)|uniref:ornithine cyclodeaminase family protein n=1 Tax=Phenylobacterium sp. TaxID=1871053 RepID=UPI002E367C10|nr:ornithine cyclodeaminase family protein [Phenylobacterium sp.]HEX3366328.1 ornithine cyclodeaminase family protein [Phenylobacterium sp.]
MPTTVGRLIVFDAAEVRRRLDPDATRKAVRQAMIALSDGRVRQNLRSFIGLGDGRTFAIMPAALGDRAAFGAKLVSVFHDGAGRKTHEGLVVLFDGETGVPVCVADAGEVTAIRTPAASAAATEALARPDADNLAVLGLGRQAMGHIAALARVRPLKSVRVWGRDAGRARAFAERAAQEIGLPVEAVADAERAVAEAAIICTVTGATDPVLKGRWLAPGSHVNLVGSSSPAQAEADDSVVTRGRFFVDHREHVLAHGGEFLRARAQESAIAAEIGEVYAGTTLGRTSADEITVYKSLGHAVQDLAAVAWLHTQTAKATGDT